VRNLCTKGAAGRGSRFRRKHTAAQPRRTRGRPLILEQLEPRLLLSSLPIISEFLASNKSGLKDSFGDYSDWIELYNPDSQQAVDLTHWKLKYGKNTIWEFPDHLTLGPGAFRVIFASGRNLTDLNGELHTNFNLNKNGADLSLLDASDTPVPSSSYTDYPTQQSDISYGVGQQVTEAQLLPAGATARFYVPTSDIGSSWTQVGFADSSWASGPTGLGFANLGPGFASTVYKSSLPSTIASLATAQSVIDVPANQSLVLCETAPVIIYLNTGSSANFFIFIDLSLM